MEARARTGSPARPSCGSPGRTATSRTWAIVLEADPHRRLSYTWPNYQLQHAEMFGWTDEVIAERVKEWISKVSFDLEPMGSVVKLTVVHEGFEGETEMKRAVSGGWPLVLSNLKTMLESGETLDWPSGARLDLATENA